MPVIAITQHSPEQVMGSLMRKDPKTQVTFLPPRAFLNPERSNKYRDIIFVVGTSDYDRNAVAIREMPDKLIFVFGHTSLLKYYGLEGAENISDCKPNPRPKLTPVGSYLNDLIAQTIEGSLFHQLMTFIYTLPSKTHQKPVTTLVCSWIHSGGSMSDLDDRLAELSKEIKLSTKVVATLKKHLSKPVAVRLRSAFNDLNAGKCSTVGEAAVKHNVQTFELSYIEGNLNKLANATDKYVGNHGL